MIAPTTIDAIRERVDLIALIRETVKLERRGRSFVGLCPFHPEKSPSFHVSPERGFYHCFGCKESGSAFDFVMKLEGLTFPEAARRLAERAGVELEQTQTDAERREADAARRGKEELYGVNSLAAHYYETMLREHPLARFARDEIERRGLVATDPTGPIADALQAFRVGYAPDGWEGLVNYLRQQGISPIVAEKVGLIHSRKSGQGHYDGFRHRLMFAIIDVQGRVVGFSGRVLPDPQTGAVDKTVGKYINSPESPVYRKGETLFGLYQARQATRDRDETILVEGNFDVVSLHARGVKNVVAPLGTAFTPAQAKLLRRFAPSVVLLFDADAAGRKATREARATCREAGLSAKVAVLPDGKDPDDLARERGEEGVRAVVAHARGILEHLLDEALDEGFARLDAHERAARVKHVVALISSEDDPTVRAMAKAYADRIVQRIEVPGVATLADLQPAIERALAASFGPTTHEQAPPAGPWQARSRDQVHEIGGAILGSFMEWPTLLDDPELSDAIDLLEGDVALALAALRQIRSEEKSLDGAAILAHLPPALHTSAARSLAAPRHASAEDARTELLSNALKLKKLSLFREKARVEEAIPHVRRGGDIAAEDALLRDIDRRAREKNAALKRTR